MSKINNQPNGFLVDMDQYIGAFANDMLQRFQVEASVLPCIYTGLSVSAGVGLNVTVTAGTARGQDIVFTESVPTATESLPTKVEIASTATVAVPAASTGWIVLNVNILPDGPEQPEDPTTGDYTVEADDGDPSPTVTPVFVSSLQPAVGVVYPYTQIVLAAVASDGAAITSVDMTGGNRSFDFSSFFSRASVSSAVGYWFAENDSVTGSGVSIPSTASPAAGTGTELVSVDVTPNFLTTKLKIRVYVPHVTYSDSNYPAVLVLYNMTDSTFIKGTIHGDLGGTGGFEINGHFDLEAVVDSFSGTKTFAAYIGVDDPDAGQTMTINPLFGGNQNSVIEVTEYIVSS
jgi:hypothetical protein